jgi:hypothetical protein
MEDERRPGVAGRAGLPIYRDDYAVGPTILDMIVRPVLPVTPTLRARFALPNNVADVPIWLKRQMSTLWSGPDRPGKQASQRSQTLDLSCAGGSGGRPTTKFGFTAMGLA